MPFSLAKNEYGNKRHKMNELLIIEGFDICDSLSKEESFLKKPVFLAKNDYLCIDEKAVFTAFLKT